MQKISSLNDLYKQYSWRILERKQFEGLIFEYILENHRRFHLHNWTRDECVDYLSWLYPRMSRAIDSYQETGASFEAYISAMVHWSSKEYRSRLADRRITENTAWALRAAETAVHDNEPEYLTEPNLNAIANPRQILFLFLKSYYFISDDFLNRIAPHLGVDREELRKMIDKLRELRTDRDEEIRCLQERIHCQFYRCITVEKRLNAVPESSARYAKMKTQLERARVRLNTMRKRLASFRLEATNRQIADTLGIAKGTIDSSLSALKRKVRRARGENPKLKKK
jgi:hypothetical protein